VSLLKKIRDEETFPIRQVSMDSMFVEVGQVGVFNISQKTHINDQVVMKIKNKLKSSIRKILDAPFFPSVWARRGSWVPFAEHGMKIG
jgi:hypothetical protein